ncbi:MAG: DUF1289 domain-containing protein [Gammaproteobacteria bacterium]|nr:DUF1289 domain-containing protein [Gammaproteobacteria bacterium]
MGTPCRSTCKLNSTAVCVGCFRHMAEIANWNRLSLKRRHVARIMAQKRRLARPYAQQPLDQLEPITSYWYRQFKRS